MDSEKQIAAQENTGPATRIGGGVPGVGGEKPASAVVKEHFTDAAKQRRERIKKLEARLEREIARDNATTRKERNGQLFVWGAMIESIYRDGNAQERDLLRRWAKQKLTDKRHLQRAENGFARIEDEAAEKADA